MTEGPRIYNLFPLLAGSVRDWEAQLPRIAAMDFNWVFLNPFHYPGFSGSLYAVKDYYRLHPLFQGRSHKSPDQLLREFLQEAEALGISVMMDLVINHTAKDSELVATHPEWFAQEPGGEIRSPFAVDPDDPQKITIWGDLAEIDYATPAHQEAILNYWKDLVRHYTRLGFKGFRCDAAYKVPGRVWAEVIGAAREVEPKTQFFAETLGCRPDEIEQLAPAGFDYLFNSSKYWDFHADWLLDQYEVYRHIAPSVAFPESHDTERVAAESGGDERDSRLRYLFAAFFSAGVMMTIGYEFGFRRKPHVVDSTPDDWEAPLFELAPFIHEVNRMKASSAVLNEEGPQQRVTPRAAPIVGLLRRRDGASGRALGLINSDPVNGHRFSVDDLKHEMAMELNAIQDISSLGIGHALAEGGAIHLAPREMRVFYTRD